MTLQTEVWEGWTVQNFIDEVEIAFQFQEKFDSRQALKKWCMGEQPYYKKYIPLLVDHFVKKHNQKWGTSL